MVPLVTVMRLALEGLLALFPGCLAAIAITSPSASSSWRIRTSSQVAFTSSSKDDPDEFTVAILNADQKILSGAYALASSAQLSLAKSSIQCPGLPVGHGYVLIFANVSNNAQVFAASEQFSIEPASSNSSTSPVSTPTSSFLVFPSQLELPSFVSINPASTVSSSRPSSIPSQASTAHRSYLVGSMVGVAAVLASVTPFLS